MPASRITRWQTGRLRHGPHWLAPLGLWEPGPSLAQRAGLRRSPAPPAGQCCHDRCAHPADLGLVRAFARRAEGETAQRGPSPAEVQSPGRHSHKPLYSRGPVNILPSHCYAGGLGGATHDLSCFTLPVYTPALPTQQAGTPSSLGGEGCCSSLGAASTLHCAKDGRGVEARPDSPLGPGSKVRGSC